MIRAIAILRLIPFVAGICVRHWTADTAAKWRPTVQQVANITLLIVIVLALLGSWRIILGLFGDFVLLAQVLFVVIMIALGWFLSTGDRSIRKATEMVEPGSQPYHWGLRYHRQYSA